MGRVDVIVAAMKKPLKESASKGTRKPDPMMSSDFSQDVEGSDVELETHAEKLLSAIKEDDAAAVGEAFKAMLMCCADDSRYDDPEEKDEEE